MTQITHGVKTILSRPFIYALLQSLASAHKVRQYFVADFIKPFHGMKILDVGCGPADILSYLPHADYWGFDISEAYINQARIKFGKRGKFQCKELQLSDLAGLPLFDAVLALGFIHHLDDKEATIFMELASKALKSGGRLLSFDPCFDPSQNQMSRFLVRNDRGKNVRDKACYEALAKTAFKSTHAEVRHQTWIPYTRCFMECRK